MICQNVRFSDTPLAQTILYVQCMSEYGMTEYRTTPKTELTGVPFSDVKNCLKNELAQFGSLSQIILYIKKKYRYNGLAQWVVRKLNDRINRTTDIRTMICSNTQSFGFRHYQDFGRSYVRILAFHSTYLTNNFTKIISDSSEN